jgi:TrmH family RNA methyltransferase
MPLRIVQSKQNIRLKELRRALACPGRDRRGLAGGLVGIEGPNLLEEALSAGLRVDCVFIAQGAEHLLEGLRLPESADLLLVPRELLNSVLATETPQPVAALVEPPEWSWEQLLGVVEKAAQPLGKAAPALGKTAAPLAQTAPLIVVLAGLQDPGNLGTILRSAEAFGATGLLSLPGTVSAWNPKAVRASAGSLFRLPLISASGEDGFARLRAAGVKIFSTAVAGAAAADRIDLAGPVALIIGNEGNGVPEAVASEADQALTIPCPGPVESLNAAVAASVLLYEASRQRAGNATRLRCGKL